MTQVEKREAQTGALAEVVCQPYQLVQLSVMYYRRPADFIKVGIFQWVSLLTAQPPLCYNIRVFDRFRIIELECENKR